MLSVLKIYKAVYVKDVQYYFVGKNIILPVAVSASILNIMDANFGNSSYMCGFTKKEFKEYFKEI